MLLCKPGQPDSRAPGLDLDAQQCEYYLLGLVRDADRTDGDRAGDERFHGDVERAPPAEPQPAPAPVEEADAGEEKYTTSAQANRPRPPLAGRVAYTHLRPESATLHDAPGVCSPSGTSTPQSSSGKRSFFSQAPSIDPSTHKFCEVCGGDVALSTGLCWRCEGTWTGAADGEWMQTRNLDVRPAPSPEWTDHVSSGSICSLHADSDPTSAPPRPPCEFPTRKPLPQPRAIPQLLTLNLQPPPGCGKPVDVPGPSPTPPSPGPFPLDSYRRSGCIPKPLQLRSLLKSISALDFELLSPTSKSLIPTPLKTRARQRTARNVMYDSFSYYFEDFHFKHNVQVREVRMPRPSRRLAERCAQRVACGAAGWV
ncbi:Uncharacterized protein TCAP_02343 [Tolypocladium capitatum]|uniref:Uncharacterized protein n=1 Tax=Tolypocladium capitatum TaxID=45235 RepID=A0A2K3QJM8_9HYPO|nr:Uncharacterized protein TCAP_02343 [Tolypocladium capitatum]